MFETCLKIRGLGVDTSGTLDALSGVLCAASKGKGTAQCPRPEEAAGDGHESETPSKDTAAKTVKGGEGPVDNRQEDKANSSGAEQTDADPPTSKAAAADGKAKEEEEEPFTGTSPSSPALWSLEFAYSELESVLDSLETAVSGLTFLVGTAVTEDDVETEEEASTLW